MTVLELTHAVKEMARKLWQSSWGVPFAHVHLGPLNYIVSGPELHRWHHSELASESDTNFGNNLIIWDVLFGTRFLPKDREVGSLGLLNRKYPMGFLAQMKTPFISGLEKE